MMPKQDSVYSTECCINVNGISAQFLLDKTGTIDEIDDLQEQLIRYNLHTHAHGEIFLCQQQSIQINLTHVSVHLKEGDIIYIPSNVPHVCITPNVDKRFIAFGMRFSSKTPSEFQRHLSAFMDSAKPQILRNQPELVESWNSLFNHTSSTHPDLMALEIFTLLTQTALCEFSDLPLPCMAYDPNASENSTCIAELEHIIYSQFMTRLTRSDIAEKLFISTRQLDRICQKRFGKSFHDKITEYRLSAAVQLLLDTNLTAEEISRRVGFPSKSSFYRAFAREFDAAPYRFRNIQKKGQTVIDRIFDCVIS